MYLILMPQISQFNAYIDKENFNPGFTTDIERVMDALKSEGARVFKIDSLTEIKNIKATYEEITTEME